MSISTKQPTLFDYIYSINNSTALKETHTLIGKLAIFLGSNYKLVPWLKKFEKVFSSSFVCGLSTISIIKCNVAMCARSTRFVLEKYLKKHKWRITRIATQYLNQNSISETLFTHFISLRRSVFFFFCLLN